MTHPPSPRRYIRDADLRASRRASEWETFLADAWSATGASLPFAFVTRTRVRNHVAIAIVAFSALWVAACGSGSRSAISVGRSHGVTGAVAGPAGVHENVPNIDMKLTSPAFAPGLDEKNLIATAHTCDGGDTSPPIRWTSPPPITAELVVFVLASGRPISKPRVQWAVARIPATATGLRAGTLPPGAYVGENSFGRPSYTICPSRGKLEEFLVILYAIKHPLAISRQFNGVTLYERLEKTARDEGVTGFYYRRR